jgi:hypothetical protein
MRTVDLRRDTVAVVVARLVELAYEYRGTVRARGSAEVLELVCTFIPTERIWLALPERYGRCALRRGTRRLDATETLVEAGEEITWTHVLSLDSHRWLPVP